MAKSDPPSAGTVEAVERACGVIRALKERNGAGVTELADHLGMSKSGTHKQLATLVDAGYVRRQEGTYRLGYQFLSDGEYVKENSLLYDVGAPEIDALARECNDCAYLTALQRERAYCIHTAEGEDSVATDVVVGQHVSLYESAAGKAVLSYMPEKNREEFLGRGSPGRAGDTIVDRDELERELESIRKKGVAFDDEGHVQGIRGVAAPILSPDEDVLGAVAVSGPVSLLTDERFEEELPELVGRTTNFIEVKFSLASRDPHQDGSHVPKGFY